METGFAQIRNDVFFSLFFLPYQKIQTDHRTKRKKKQTNKKMVTAISPDQNLIYRVGGGDYRRGLFGDASNQAEVCVCLYLHCEPMCAHVCFCLCVCAYLTRNHNL